MAYDSSALSLNALFQPVVEAEDALARLDDRLSRKSEAGEASRRTADGLLKENTGWIERSHFAEACNAMWLAGELVHVEDLVLHDARMDIRTPTHELTIAHTILRARRQIASNPPSWALSAKGLASLRGRRDGEYISEPARPAETPGARAGEQASEEAKSAAEFEFETELARFDEVMKRSAETLAHPRSRLPRTPNVDIRHTATLEGDPLVYDPDWDEDARVTQWLGVHDVSRALPPLLAAAILWDAWETIEPLQHQHWLGPLLVSAMLRERGKTRIHLGAFNAGLKNVPRAERRSRDMMTRLLAFIGAARDSSIAHLKEVERLSLARVQLERKLKDRRSTSSLPALIDLVLARPIISAALVAKELKISQRGALNLIAEIGMREITGRGRFRAWGIL